MQPVQTQEHLQYASLGWRIAAVAVDTLVLFGLLIVGMLGYLFVLMGQGKLDPNDPASVQKLADHIQASTLVTNLIVFGGLFLYYAIMEGLFAASVGKLVFRMRVTALDGSRPGAGAVLVRNLIRIPEAWLLYVPAGVSCAVSPRCQRLGDHAARTVVVRRAAAPAFVSGTATWPVPPAAGQDRPPAPTSPAVPAPPAAVVAPEPPASADAPALSAPSLGDALAALKTAALTTQGAHESYLRFSELELSRAGADPQADAEAAGDAAPAEESYSAGYVGAWYTLADAVAALREAGSGAEAAAARAGTTLDAATAAQPDLAHVLQRLEPYLRADSDERIHDAFLEVARAAT